MNIDPSLIDVAFEDHDGYPAEIQSGDTKDALMCAAKDAGAKAYDFPSHLWIEPKDWPDVAAENDKYHTWPIDYIDRFTNQNPTHECTTHAFRTVFEAARNRQRRIAIGPPVPDKRLDISAKSSSVWISPLSLYSEANPGQWGGAGVVQILNIAAKRGCLPDKIQPRDWGFKHYLHGTCGEGGINQSNGRWTSVSNFPDGWKETAKLLKPLEYIFPGSWEETVCLVLHGFAVGVGRSGHSIPYCKWVADKKLMQYPDSYDVFRYDSASSIRATVGGSYAIVSTTVPDDWEKPAG